ncbi:MAG: ATP-grasp domain-containing protein, partial [Acidobacteria bacterium]|nr:ATP-grasp domain-containing protein [Acidobacteriota bacterium]
IPRLISAAEITGAHALHPGYGFLAENAHFAEVCEACQIKFIGPSPSVIRQMGDKAKAREMMESAGVPCVPGSRGTLGSDVEAVALARKIGYPVIVKASAGGGGRGMRIARSEEELRSAIQTAMNEAKKAFDVADVYLEKYIEDPRHVEFQILGDEHGALVHLGERECSIQRRHQKLVEESPSMALGPKLRRRMSEAALAGARAVGYQNAGTIEFLLAPDGKFYFIEMNTRIQVEHPVTEMVTGLDLIREQIRIAAGEPLGYTQDDIRFHGHAIECRVNAEDSESFVPSPGRITTFNTSGGPGVRVDTAAHADGVISPYYDSLVAKAITFGNSRPEAISRMRRLLDLMVVEGIKTTIPLLRRVLADPDFLDGRISTHFLERLLARGRSVAAHS